MLVASDKQVYKYLYSRKLNFFSAENFSLHKQFISQTVKQHDVVHPEIVQNVRQEDIYEKTNDRNVMENLKSR